MGGLVGNHRKSGNFVRDFEFPIRVCFQITKDVAAQITTREVASSDAM
jgi:hypothetical protein